MSTNNLIKLSIASLLTDQLVKLLFATSIVIALLSLEAEGKEYAILMPVDDEDAEEAYALLMEKRKKEQQEKEKREQKQNVSGENFYRRKEKDRINLDEMFTERQSPKTTKEESEEVIDKSFDERIEEIEAYRKEFRKLDIIDRIEELKESIADMEDVVMKKNIETDDSELMKLEDRVKEIQKQIQELMK